MPSGSAGRPNSATDIRVTVYPSLAESPTRGLPIMASTRRLTAILAADVAGYSPLMGADQEGTHERLKAHIRERGDPKTEQHRRRTVKNPGDARVPGDPGETQ